MTALALNNWAQVNVTFKDKNETVETCVCALVNSIIPMKIRLTDQNLFKTVFFLINLVLFMLFVMQRGYSTMIKQKHTYSNI